MLQLQFLGPPKDSAYHFFLEVKRPKNRIHWSSFDPRGDPGHYVTGRG